MIGIPIYAKDCGDFSTNGICLLRPVSCTVEETANGLYEQEAGSQEPTTTTVTRSIYRVSTSSGKLRLRQKPSTSAKILSSWKKRTEVTLLEQTSSS